MVKVLSIFVSQLTYEQQGHYLTLSVQNFYIVILMVIDVFIPPYWKSFFETENMLACDNQHGHVTWSKAKHEHIQFLDIRW